ncbi:hypothetical protein DSL64_26945 [Dyadobacter luteus]|uniref:Uncharacterized protein n=1 Tax=Dyadobacter luteus TaxID=2259619 RepID=A0A3D8Y456_9BACT|nr:hypothetical protein DSL64_26945 [Dyadobacter luteus]
MLLVQRVRKLRERYWLIEQEMSRRNDAKPLVKQSKQVAQNINNFWGKLLIIIFFVIVAK